jgi:hypothetical protein
MSRLARSHFLRYPASSSNGRRAPLVAVLLLLMAFAGSGADAGVGNFLCTSNACGVDSNPIYINIYWDNSLDQWDLDVAASSAEMQSGRIDALLTALFHTKYSAPLSQYGVNTVDRWPSLAAGNCGPPPATIDDAPGQISSLLLCLFTHDPQAYPQMLAGALGYSPYDLLNRFSPPAYVQNAVYNVFLPPQTKPSSPDADHCKNHQAWHDSFSPFGVLDPDFIYSVPVTIVPTFGGAPGVPGCSSGIDSFFTLLTHEMVEAATDVFPDSIFGWKQPFWDGGNEIADLCETSPSTFLFGEATQYWSNNANACITPLSGSPTISSASVCGSGPKMTFTLNGSFGPEPSSSIQRAASYSPPASCPAVWPPIASTARPAR